MIDADDPRHGTSTGYNRHVCRCEACVLWNTEHVQAWRMANPEKHKKHAEAHAVRQRAKRAALRERKS